MHAKYTESTQALHSHRVRTPNPDPDPGPPLAELLREFAPTLLGRGEVVGALKVLGLAHLEPQTWTYSSAVILRDHLGRLRAEAQDPARAEGLRVAWGLADSAAHDCRYVETAEVGELLGISWWEAHVAWCHAHTADYPQGPGRAADWVGMAPPWDPALRAVARATFTGRMVAHVVPA